MTLLRSEFKFVDRGCKDTMLLIPGWGLDYRIFDKLDIEYNYLYSILPWPQDFAESAKKETDRLGLKQVSILGQSMGAFLAVDFAEKYPKIVKELILVGIRKNYSNADMKPAREYLAKNRVAFMYWMYDQSFSPSEKDGLSWFKANLLKSYTQEMDNAYLSGGLDYLEKSVVTPDRIKCANVRFIHGDSDAIAPIAEAEAIARNVPHAKFDKVKGGGHVLLLRNDINSIISG